MSEEKSKKFDEESVGVGIRLSATMEEDEEEEKLPQQKSSHDLLEDSIGFDLDNVSDDDLTRINASDPETRTAFYNASVVQADLWLQLAITIRQEKVEQFKEHLEEWNKGVGGANLISYGDKVELAVARRHTAEIRHLGAIVNGDGEREFLTGRLERIKRYRSTLPIVVDGPEDKRQRIATLEEERHETMLDPSYKETWEEYIRETNA